MPRSKTTDISALIKAINANSANDAAAAIAAGCDVNATYLDMSPLICAVHDGRAELVQLLLEHGADPCQRDRNTPWTPFMLASIQVHLPSRRHRPARIAKESREIVRILEGVGAHDPEADGIYGRVEKEKAILKSVQLRETKAETQMFDAEGVVIEYPSRLRRDMLGRLIPSITLLEMARWYKWKSVEDHLATRTAE